MQMKGIQGLNGWRWIFIIEGIMTIVLGVGSYWSLVDFPDKAHKSFKFITQREAQHMIARVNKDRGDGNSEPFNASKFFRAGLDLKVWGFAMVRMQGALP